MNDEATEISLNQLSQVLELDGPCNYTILAKTRVPSLNSCQTKIVMEAAHGHIMGQWIGWIDRENRDWGRRSELEI